MVSIGKSVNSINEYYNLTMAMYHNKFPMDIKINLKTAIYIIAESKQIYTKNCRFTKVKEYANMMS